MNNQQELINAINNIQKNRNTAYDTPAEVLRVDGDTVWVHIDGGADETPVLKTINCEQGEKVQVRISNGSAFLVGNASAPPTDDKRANVAHFVAVEADEKADTAIKSVDALSQTVESKVDSGDSNIVVLSSTMYQNANGVNIYNGNLAVGDSYAHIDGDSFDIKNVTTAGTIDDTNDTVVASFGPISYISQMEDDGTGGYMGSQFVFLPNYLQIRNIISGASQSRSATLNTVSLGFTNSSTGYATNYGADYIFNGRTKGNWPGDSNTYLYHDKGKLYVKDRIQLGSNGQLLGSNGDSLLDEWTPAVTASTSGSNVVAVFDNLDDSYGYFPYFEDELITVTEVTKETGTQTGTIKLTYTLEDATSGFTQCYLRILK